MRAPRSAAVVVVRTVARVGPTVFLSRAIGLQPTASTLSKAFYPSGVVGHDCMPSTFRNALRKAPVYPNQTSWLSVAAAKQLKATMELMTPSVVKRNFLMGQQVREHLNSLVPHGCKHRWVRGCGGLIATNLPLDTGAGGLEYHHNRILLPFDLTLREVTAHMRLRPNARACADPSCTASGTPLQHDASDDALPARKSDLWCVDDNLNMKYQKCKGIQDRQVEMLEQTAKFQVDLAQFDP